MNHNYKIICQYLHLVTTFKNKKGNFEVAHYVSLSFIDKLLSFSIKKVIEIKSNLRPRNLMLLKADNFL